MVSLAENSYYSVNLSGLDKIQLCLDLVYKESGKLCFEQTKGKVFFFDYRKEYCEQCSENHFYTNIGGFNYFELDCMNMLLYPRHLWDNHLEEKDFPVAWLSLGEIIYLLTSTLVKDDDVPSKLCSDLWDCRINVLEERHSFSVYKPMVFCELLPGLILDKGGLEKRFASSLKQHEWEKGLLSAFEKVKTKSLPKRKHGFVYFILDEVNNCVKIGMTSKQDVSSRFSALQMSTVNPLKVLKAISTNDCVEKERHFHHTFKHLRIRGEWFKYEGDLKNFLQ